MLTGATKNASYKHIAPSVRNLIPASDSESLRLREMIDTVDTGCVSQ